MQPTLAPSKPSIPSTPSMQILQPTSSSSDPTPAPAPAPSEASVPFHTENKTLDEVQNDVSPSKPNPPLPQHLRERWILPEKEPIKPIRLRRDTDGNYTIVQDGSVSPIAFYPPISTPMMMNPMDRPAMMFPMYSQNLTPTPWPTQFQNVANVNSNMLPYNMMPQQLPVNTFSYP